MGRKSTVAQQDAAILQEVHDLIRKGRTIDEITEVLHALGAEVSRSATARYVKGERESMRQMVKAQTMARVWVEQFGKEPDGDVGRLLPQMLEAVAHRTLDNMAESEGVKSPEEVRVMARALKDLSGAKRGNIDIELKMRQVRQEERQAMLAEQRAKLEAMPNKGGVTAATKAEIRKTLGIDPS
ncbi:MAG: hypothetical protein A3E01_05220 [Gammaproteobacteria bacterium RIFCSPHIGHO2_12_FULL_63_22]|nr:MAG: hypothetical protein A3E01_05220 [Gammaproteobacteria bacterium RIFCSPHIGHO2_12_FULL_63_22]